MDHQILAAADVERLGHDCTAEGQHTPAKSLSAFVKGCKWQWLPRWALAGRVCSHVEKTYPGGS